MTSYNLKGFDNVFSATLNNDIQDGVLWFFDWALLEKGNYFNVSKGELTPEGYDCSKLRMETNKHYTDGQVWSAFRGNWVWESGVSYSPSPTLGGDNTRPGISGIYVNDTYYPTSTTGDYSYKIDYVNGRVIFDTAIPTGSKVQAEYSYKWINMLYAASLPWIREIQQRSNELDASFYEKDKGRWNLPPEARVQLPAIAIEVVPNRSFKGYQLGGGQWVYTDLLFHCIAEDEITRNKLVDIVSLQNDKKVYLFNSNQLNTSGVFPLDIDYTPVSGALRYPDLVSSYPGGSLWLTKSSVQSMTTIHSNVYGGIVRVTTEGIKTNI